MKRHRWMVAVALFATVLTACEEMGRTVNEALAQRESGANGAMRDRVQQQLGEDTGIIDTTAAARLSAAFRAASARALPAVVQITTIAMVERPEAAFRGRADLEEIPEHQRAQGSGSGFIIDPRGYILTNNHVIQDAVDVQVMLLNGREYRAEVVGSDPSTDVAVIRIDPAGEELPVIEMGDSELIRVGDWVIALGNPMDLAFTATAGIVSAKERSIDILRRTTGLENTLESFIQTDAAINPGNSGGPLVDLNGRVIGINTAIESATGYFTGAGFAVPIALAQKVARDLIQFGVVRRPRLGVSIQDVNAADAELYALPSVSGVEITSITPGESADRAGLEIGDVVLNINEHEVHSVADLQARVALFQPGDRIEVRYIRYGKEMSAEVALGEFEVAREREARRAPDRPRNPLGFTIGELPAQIAARLNLAAAGAPFVTGVDPFGPARGSGLVPGHVIRRFNGRDIRTARDLERAAAGIRTGEIISLIVVNAQGSDPQPTIVNYRAE
jgi:serine protease Do